MSNQKSKKVKKSAKFKSLPVSTVSRTICNDSYEETALSHNLAVAFGQVHVFFYSLLQTSGLSLIYALPFTVCALICKIITSLLGTGSSN